MENYKVHAKIFCEKKRYAAFPNSNNGLDGQFFFIGLV